MAPPRFPLLSEVARLCSLGQMLLWGDPAQGHIRAVVIVGPHPLRGEVLNLFNAGPVIPGYLQMQALLSSYLFFRMRLALDAPEEDQLHEKR
jgi:hypothetical protein